MPEIDPVILQLRADMAKYQADIKGVTVMVQDKLAVQERAVQRLENNYRTSFSRVGAHADAARASVVNSLRGMGVAIGGVSAIALAREFLKIADASKNLDAQLRLATSTFGTFGQAQEDVRRIADATRSDLAGTAELYGNFVRNARELGISQDEAARATETVAKTFKISGAGAVEAAQSTRQLVQALQSGTLRGDEFNTVMEAAPRLSRLLADSLGVSVGELRKMAEEGELTSDKLTRAFTDKKFTAAIDAEFKELPVTFDQAMTQVSNAALITFGAFDRGGQFSTALANFISDGTDGFTDLERSAEQFGVNTRAVFDGFSSLFQPLLDAGRQAFAALGIEAVNFGDLLGSMVEGNLKRTQEILNFTASPLNYALEGKQPFNFADRFSKGREGSKTKAALDKIMKGDPFADVENKATGAGTRVVSSSSKSKAKPKAAPKSPLREDVFTREEDNLNDQILAAKRQELGLAEDRATRLQSQSAIDLERIDASRAAAVEEINNDKRLTDAQREKLIALTNTLAAMRSTQVVVEREKAAAELALRQRLDSLRDEEETLSAQADIAETRAERLDIERRLLAIQEEEERARLEAAIAAGQIADAAKARANLETRQSARRKGIERDNASPMDRYKREITDTANNIDDTFEQIQVDGLRALNDGLTDAIMNSKSLGDVFSNVARSIIADLIRIAIRQTIVNSLMQGIGSLFGGGSGSFVPSSAPLVGTSFAASGTNFAHAGVYRVGESGPETVMLPQGAKVIPADLTRQIAGKPAQSVVVVQVRAGELFEASVQQISSNVAAPMAVQAGMASSEMTERRMSRRARNRLS